MEDRPADILVVLDHLGQQRLESILPQVPLQDSEADPHSVEVAGNAAEAIRRLSPRFESAG